MQVPRPEAGLVIRYGFLWDEEARRGAEGGRKSRPCAIIAAIEEIGDKTVVTVVPITHSPPIRSGTTIELPAAVKRSLRLDDERSWIVTDETNTFIWPGPDIEPVEPQGVSIIYGRLPRAMAIATLREVMRHRREGRLRRTKRTE